MTRSSSGTHRAGLPHSQLQRTVAPVEGVGLIGGVIETEMFIELMHQLAGYFDPALCSGTTFESLAEQLRQGSDVLVDGSQDPSQECNAISIGIGFEATAAQLAARAASVLAGRGHGRSPARDALGGGQLGGAVIAALEG